MVLKLFMLSSSEAGSSPGWVLLLLRQNLRRVVMRKMSFCVYSLSWGRSSSECRVFGDFLLIYLGKHRSFSLMYSQNC